MRSDQLLGGESAPALARGVVASGLFFVVLCGAFATGCGIFGPRPEPPPAPVPAPAKTPDLHLLLRLDERRLYVVENDVKHPPAGYKVAIGAPKWPTPTGRFQINEMVENPDFVAFDFNDPKKPDRGRIPPGPNNPLGLRWIGFATAHGWQVGFHGTAKVSALGHAVSHGCVRMANPDVVEVFNRVKLGTYVVVE
jgi:L,D-transpeptidase catalytic domain